MISWSRYFQLRTSLNRYRIGFGIPTMVAASTAIVVYVPFNPIDTVLGMDPALAYSALSVGAGLAGYVTGGALGNIMWRLRNRQVMSTLDRMDRMFYRRISMYRAERGQSPYLQSTGNVLGRLDQTKNNLLLNKGKGSTTTNTSASGNDLAFRTDYYGEKIKSVADYRNWLRRQRKISREQLVGDAKLKPIRGISSK